MVSSGGGVCWVWFILGYFFRVFGGKNPRRIPTPPKTNMSTENEWLEDAFPIEIVNFCGTC